MGTARSAVFCLGQVVAEIYTYSVCGYQGSGERPANLESHESGLHHVALHGAADCCELFGAERFWRT